MPTLPSNTDSYQGKLQFRIVSRITAAPIENASVQISYTGIPENIPEQLNTDNSGRTDTIDLPAPPLEYSLDPNSGQQPYSEYTLTITAPDFEPITIAGVEILANTLALQNVRMRPVIPAEPPQIYVIPAHTLYGVYPPKIPEAEIKPTQETGEIVLSRVVVPEYIVVHDGSPRDSTARNYYVKYKDYIKNVAACEIYSTWPSSHLQAGKRRGKITYPKKRYISTFIDTCQCILCLILSI